MKKLLIPLFFTPVLSQAALVYDMDFERILTGSYAAGSTIATSNYGTNPGAATVVGGAVDIVNVGTVSTFCGNINMGQVLDLGDNEWLDTNVGLGSTLGITSQDDYTMSAWVNFPSVGGGDRMIFGSEGGGGGQLHLGTRNDNYHSGHWGDDLQNNGTPSNDIGNWTYVTFTGDSATGEQEIFVDGVSIASGAAGGALRTFQDLLIGGSNNDNNRDFIGQIGGISVWDEVLTLEQQHAAAWAVAIPEPSRVLLLAFGGLLFGLRRRR